MSVERDAVAAAERDWWLRALLVVGAPRPVFAELRNDADEAAEARQEPLTAIVFLAGIAAVLGTTIAGRLLDDPEYDALLVAVWAIVGGGVYGLVSYFVIGAVLFVAASFAGSLGSYRRARHVVGLACVPIALSLAVWPVRLALFGDDVFRSGGSDSGVGDALFELLIAAAVAWSALLLVIGVRTVHGWTWPRAVAASAPALALPVLAYARALGLL